MSDLDPELDKYKARQMLSDPEQVRRMVLAKVRRPFEEALIEVVGLMPDRDNLLAFSNAYPDKWMKIVKDLANLSGYKDGVEVTMTDVLSNPAAAGDAQLIHELDKLSGQLDALVTDQLMSHEAKTLFPGQAVEDAEFTEVEPVGIKEQLAAEQKEELSLDEQIARALT